MAVGKADFHIYAECLLVIGVEVVEWVNRSTL